MQLAEQDPLINVRQDDSRQELSVSLYGEVQKEVIQATLASDYGLDVSFRETTPIYVERPIGGGEAVEMLHAETNPFYATIGLRVDPAPAGSGIEFRLDVDARTAPLYVYKTLESFAAHMDEYVRHDAAGGALRLAGHRLHRDDDPVHVQHRGRAAVATGADEHGRRLPQAHAARAHAGARARRNGGLRADGRASASRSRRTRSAPSSPAWRGSAATVETPTLRGELAVLETVLPVGAGA